MSNSNVTNGIIEMAIIATTAVILLLATHPSKAECNCSNSNSAEGQSDGRDYNQRYRLATEPFADYNYPTYNIPQLTPEERARWDTQATDIYTRGWVRDFGSWLGFGNPYSYGPPSNYHGPVHSDSGWVGPGMGN